MVSPEPVICFGVVGPKRDSPGRLETVRTFYHWRAGLDFLLATYSRIDCSSKLAAWFGPQVSVGNVVERWDLSPRGFQ
jgi:hypothetical protein